jgi:c(7)-type cytochrome triheme protein
MENNRWCQNISKREDVNKSMRKAIVSAVAFLIVIVLTAPAFAVGPGKTVVYLKGGKVVFDGKSHAKAKCNACHPALFKMKKGAAEMTMKDMEAGKFCGACHDGTKAFSVKDAAKCGECHKK